MSTAPLPQRTDVLDVWSTVWSTLDLDDDLPPFWD